MKTQPSRLRSQRGSLLIVSMIMSAVIGISIVSYIKLGQTSQVIANRALYNNGAMNLAENGLEEAMYSINQLVADPAYSWTGWTNDGTTSSSSAWRAWTGYTFDQNATGIARVYVYNYTGVVAPAIVARATVTLGGASGAPIEKWIVVRLNKTSKFANGLVAKDSITFNGNGATVDSWNSDPDNNNATAAADYDDDTKRDNGSVGSISVAVGAIGVNNADIFGYAATGGSAVTVGPQGKVGPFGTADGVIAPDHTSTDFSASFDPVTTPTTYAYNPIATINNNTTLPGAVTAAADGKYYIEAPAINLNNKALTIEPGKEVVLKLTNTGSGPSSAIDVGGGSGAINIGVAGKLLIYTAGDISIGGSGVLNGGDTDATANQPINFQIWGTKTSGTQNISVSGNGVFSGIIYAPQGAVTMNGGGNSGNVSGSIVSNTIVLNGSVKFHYDESLGNFGAGNPYRVASWRELTTEASRAAFASVMDF